VIIGALVKYELIACVVWMYFCSARLSSRDFIKALWLSFLASLGTTTR